MRLKWYIYVYVNVYNWFYCARIVDHWTPLMYASYMGHDTILDLLFEAGADPNIKTIHGITALMLAASCGYESIAYTLLQVYDLSFKTCIYDK